MSKVPQNAAGFFTCSICSREFSGLNSLKKHMPIHTRRVQHSCDVCGHVFGKREYLMDHARRHTGDASPTCEVSTYASCVVSFLQPAYFEIFCLLLELSYTLC